MLIQGGKSNDGNVTGLDLSTVRASNGTHLYAFDANNNKTNYLVEAVARGGGVALGSGNFANPTPAFGQAPDHNATTNRNAIGAHDDIYIRAVTLAEAKAEDAPAGTRYSINGDLYVVESDSLGFLSLSHELASGRYLNYKPSGDVMLKAAGANALTDSYQIISDCLGYADEIGRWVDGEGLEYLTEQLISNEINIKIKNAVFVIDVAQAGFDFGAKTPSATTSLNSNPILGQKQLDVLDSTGMSVGDVIVITSERIWPYDIDRNLNAGEVNVIAGISGNTITLEANLKDGYTIVENVQITTYKPFNFEIENVEFKRKTREEKSSFSLRRCVRPKIRNLTLRNNGQSGGNISACFMADIQGLYLYDNYITGTATGYGLQDNGSLGTQIRGVVAKGNRRAIDFSGSFPSKFGSVDGFYVIGEDSTGSCLGTHGTAVGIEFRNGICDGGLIGIQIRSPLSVLENVTFINTETRCITLSYTMSLKVVNCKSETSVISPTQGSISSVTSRFIEVANLPNSLPNSEWLEIYNCTGSVRTVPIRIDPSLNDGIKYLIAKGNSFKIRTNSAANQLNFIAATAACNIDTSVILENSIVLSSSGVQNSLLSDNITILDTAKLITQPVKISNTSLIELWSGDGTLSNQVLDLRQSSDGRYCHLQGVVKFTVSGATSGAKLRVNGVPQKSDETKIGVISISQSNLTLQENLVTKYNRQSLYIASDGWRASGSDTEPFSDGDYYINIDIRYPLRFPFPFGLLD